MKNAFFNICVAFCVLWLLVQIAECSFNDSTGTNAYIDTAQVKKGSVTHVNDSVEGSNGTTATFEEGYGDGYENGRFDSARGHAYRHSYKEPIGRHPNYAKGYERG